MYSSALMRRLRRCWVVHSDLDWVFRGLCFYVILFLCIFATLGVYARLVYAVRRMRALLGTHFLPRCFSPSCRF